MKTAFRIITFLLILSFLSSCSSTKFVKDGEFLLDKVVFDSDNDIYKTSELSPYVRQQPNFKTFSLVKWQLFVYGWSGRDDNKWINKQLRKMGEAPVIMDTALVEQSREELGRFLINKGYLNSEVITTVDTSRHKKATVTFHIKSNEPYRIGEYTMNLSDENIDSIAHLKPLRRNWLTSPFQQSTEQFNTMVRSGRLFDRDLLDKERQRVTTLLRRRGYYAFNRDFLAYQADSTSNQKSIDLDMVLRPNLIVNPNGEVTEENHKQYYINNVSIITDANLLTGELSYSDTIRNNNVSVIYGVRGKTIRPSVLQKSSYITPGKLFSEHDIEQTYSSFASLKALKNVNIKFEEFEENDTMKLNCTILTSPAELQGFGVDLEGTNSNGDLGFASSINYQHRNLFKGSEVFSAKIRGAYESLSGGKGSGLDSYWEIGGEMSLLFPRFLFPFVSEDFRRKIRANTQLNVSYNRQRRPEYERAILSGGWGYTWQDRVNTHARHTFKMLDVDYVYMPKVDKDFIMKLPKAIVEYNYADQFIVSTGYTYSFNNYSPVNRQRNTQSMRFSVELAGNMLYGLSNILKADKGENGRYKLLGIDYYQFTKFDFDISKGVVIDRRNRIAFHLGLGLGIPYGNGEKLPFERRYFAGGANSLRGWSVRSLGPGSMVPDDSTSLVTQVGDIRLDANLEYRTKLFWRFELAAYVDAGNVWTIRPYAEQKNGNFEVSRFYKEIAMSYGLGLRMDFDFFLLRFDTGFKVYDPQQTGSKKLAISNPNFGHNFAWHFAVGYPF